MPTFFPFSLSSTQNFNLKHYLTYKSAPLEQLSHPPPQLKQTVSMSASRQFLLLARYAIKKRDLNHHIRFNGTSLKRLLPMKKKVKHRLSCRRVDNSYRSFIAQRINHYLNCNTAEIFQGIFAPGMPLRYVCYLKYYCRSISNDTWIVLPSLHMARCELDSSLPFFSITSTSLLGLQLLLYVSALCNIASLNPRFDT
jgi:hypothetical protein